MGYPLPMLKILGFFLGLLLMQQGVYHSTGVNLAPRISFDNLIQPQIASDHATHSTSPIMETRLSAGLTILNGSKEIQFCYFGTDYIPLQGVDGCSSRPLNPGCPQITLPAPEQPSDGEFLWELVVYKEPEAQSWFEPLTSWFDSGGTYLFFVFCLIIYEPLTMIKVRHSKFSTL